MFEVGAQRDTARLEDYLRAARQRWPLILVAVVAALGLGWMALSARTNTFTAQARVAVGPTPVGSSTLGNLTKPNLEREREVLGSNAVADAAIEAANLDITRTDLLRGLKISFRPDSEVLNVEYTDEDAARSAEAANAISTTYVRIREQESSAYFQNQIDDLNAEILLGEATIASLRADLSAEQITLGELTDRGPQDVAAIQTSQSRIDALQTELDDAERTQRDNESALRGAQRDLDRRPAAAEVLGDAVAPTDADGLSRNLLLAGIGLAGLLIGLTIAFLADRLDTTARDDKQVELAIGARVLGSVPRFGLRSGTGSASVVMLSEDRSNRVQAAREAYRRLATSLAFLRISEDLSCIIVTSANPGEGKSTTAANVSVALAQAGSTVVLMSADMRRPAQEECFGVPLSPGLSEYLGGRRDVNAHTVASVPNMWLISAGAPPSNPGELLGSPAFSEMMREASAIADFVVIDTPPVLSTADANAAARHVDGIVVVVDSRETTTEDLLEVRAAFDRTGARILGSVLNRKKFRSTFLRRGTYRYYSRGRGRGSAAAVPEMMATRVPANSGE